MLQKSAHCDRQIDGEDPVPTKEEKDAAEDGADNKRQPKDRADQAKGAATLFGGKVSPITAEATGKMPPAPKPWIARPSSRTPYDGESIQLPSRCQRAPRP